MDSENQQGYQIGLALATHVISSTCVTRFRAYREMKSGSEDLQASEILKLLRSEQILTVNARRKNGLILYKQFHAEFAGPGAAVGGFYDQDCQWALPVGHLSLLTPESHEERQKAYLIRRQWIRLTRKITENPVPQQRVQTILNQFENYFDAETIAQLPDEAFALSVGVLPQTVNMVRRTQEQVGRE
ncbi:MAG: hypothetical protein JOZ78_19135 [Chroococcidiopsidaceae cyanobacterium CP_BM_ER_R8_30]|nr:hypothetical protein [Chroococcidiopsidaceae cyanobacterium CP_BM_ER_R8_30]